LIPPTYRARNPGSDSTPRAHTGGRIAAGECAQAIILRWVALRLLVIGRRAQAGAIARPTPVGLMSDVLHPRTAHQPGDGKLLNGLDFYPLIHPDPTTTARAPLKAGQLRSAPDRVLPVTGPPPMTERQSSSQRNSLRPRAAPSLPLCLSCRPYCRPHATGHNAGDRHALASP